MKKMQDLTKSKLTRRTFLQGMAATGAAATLVGCSTDDGELIFSEGAVGTVVPEAEPVYERFYGSSGHNCGGRCVSVAEVSNGKIHRILTDESKTAFDGTYLDKNSRNWPQTRICTKCRSYKYRLYHPGRLLYPMKQTKKRGDLTGFQRITWDQAYKEIATKHKNIIDKYGVDGVYQIYACGSVSSQLNGSQSGAIGKTNGYAIKLMDGVITPMFASYSTHQYTYFGLNFTGMDGDALNPNDLAKNTSTLVLWGDNSVTTANQTTHSSVKIVEDMKARDVNNKVVYIGPTFSDTGVTLADEWVVSKPFTDPALVAGMVYHILDNTFDLTTGEPKANPWLDIDYLDTLVYGFFDSPAYSITEADGTIGLIDVGDRNIEAVPAGRSYASWILGNNENAQAYSETTTNYTAKQYEAVSTGFKRWATCSYDKTMGANTVYKTKQDFTVPKTPEWASEISGVPVDTIKELAEMFVRNTPVCSRWSGGQQKQMDGISNLFAVQVLHIITKNVGRNGTGYQWVPFKGAMLEKADSLSNAYTVTLPSGMVEGKKAIASCTAWHTAIKMAFADELKEGGYSAEHIPNYAKGTETTPNVYWDDGGTKAFIQWERDADGTVKTYTDIDGNEFYDWTGRATNTPVFTGIRLLYNAGGNIFINQHENSNDSRQMLEALKLNDYNNPDTFCLVSIDNFMSPTPRWSDYVLPATTFWEQDDVMSPQNSSSFYMQKVIDPPGEAKPVFHIGEELLQTYADLTGRSDIADSYYSVDNGGTPAKTIEGIVRSRFEEKKAAGAAVYKDLTWEEYKKNPVISSKPDDRTIAAHKTAAVINAYEGLTDNERANNPFIKEGNNIATNEITSGGYGNEFCNTDNAPNSAWRYQAYSPVLTWQYVNKFSKWHGYLEPEQRGQQHKDLEGDRFVLEIPVYYAYQDTFMEAYGSDIPSGQNAVNELSFLLTTTHNRYRSHSSMAENPMLRELSHRVPGRDAKGNYIPANDYGDYSNAPDKAFAINSVGVYPELNNTIDADGTVAATNRGIASYSEIYMNASDASGLGILDGDLVQVENPIGIVRCVARLTARCAKGYVDLHQGCWYDPREISGKIVDVGGNCNTLMASQPSRIDHGNGQQSAMVKITKVENY